MRLCTQERGNVLFHQLDFSGIVHVCVYHCVCALFCFFNFQLFREVQCRLDDLWMLNISPYCWCSVVYAKLSAHLYEHTHTHLRAHTNVHRHTCTHSCMFKHTCIFTHTFMCAQPCVEGCVSEQDTYGSLVVYSILTCQVCWSSVTWA